MTLPTRAEIDLYGSLDEAVACEHFLGKTLDEAVAMFEENSLAYQEDLMWMGPRAFAFYVPAVTRYLATEAARGDSDLVSCMLGNIRFRRDEVEFALARDEVRRLIEVIVSNWLKFEVDESIYGDLLTAYRDLARELA